ncbi:flagellar hook-basal body complex protein [Clostridium aciditolerans]|uniref:Flagellar hook protein FlgE n=1 Tax=Clostridium aciditolerans TaxID=339861 RepID=A0A934I476_9CLOT|nr:flagellar hook-basal body complex protein [Clostridium aciditolerans]MBI6875777.1 flagellar hook-basal body complex protein [Clostridium aciditolerans]
MLPSMYSGISGLKANQKKLDVVGNNIANSSTTAFKSQRIRFQDMISQNMAQATQATSTTGGTNPKQVGLGVQIAGIDTVTSTGNMQPTSRNLDFAIDGQGYFVVGSGPVPTDSAATDAGTITVEPAEHAISSNGVQTGFTRDGSFTLDSQGNLLTSDGLRVYGYANSNATITYSVDDVKMPHKIELAGNGKGGADTAIVDTGLVPLAIPDSVTLDGKDVRIQSVSISKDGVITAVLDGGATAALGQIAMVSFKNDAGLTKMGKNIYNASANSGAPTIRCGANLKEGEDGYNASGYGEMLQGMLEMSNVDLAEQFTDMIIASRAFQANGKIITTGDEILQDLVNLKR